MFVNPHIQLCSNPKRPGDIAKPLCKPMVLLTTGYFHALSRWGLQFQYLSSCQCFQYFIQHIHCSTPQILPVLFEVKLFSCPQLVKSEADYQGRLSRSPVLPVDSQENVINANSFAVRRSICFLNCDLCSRIKASHHVRSLVFYKSDIMHVLCQATQEMELGSNRTRTARQWKRCFTIK